MCERCAVLEARIAELEAIIEQGARRPMMRDTGEFLESNETGKPGDAIDCLHGRRGIITGRASSFAVWVRPIDAPRTSSCSPA